MLSITVVWIVPGIMAGNEIPQYTDNSGSISRRMLTFLFNKKVKKGDTQLGNKLEKELAYILHACNRAYLEAVNTNGTEDVWNIVPKYFIKSRDEMAETTNALTSFLKSDKIKLGREILGKDNQGKNIYGKEYSVRECDFVELFNEHCRDMNIPKQRWNGQYCMGPFANFDIDVDRHSRIDGVTGTYFLRVGINTEYKPEVKPGENDKAKVEGKDIKEREEEESKDGKQM